MKVAIRVDASGEIGTGHFMRCLTLANALKQQGVHIRFVCRDLPVHLGDMLADKAMELARLELAEGAVEPAGGLAHAHWLAVSQTRDGQDTIQALADEVWDWVIVDHYGIDAEWEAALRGKLGSKIMVIDDLADRMHACDILLDQNYYADMDMRYLGKVPVYCQLFLGPGYALLREGFCKLRRQVRPRSGPVKRVLVFFGGVDADSYTELAIDALSDVAASDWRVDVVIGAQHPCLERIKSASALRGFVCHVQTDKMEELMAGADLAIGAGGSATWERCAMGVPSIILVLAENQHKAAEDLDAAGVVKSLGDARLVANHQLVSAIRELVEDEKLRYKLSTASLKLVPASMQNEVVEAMVGGHV